jgi:hypothetical protein
MNLLLMSGRMSPALRTRIVDAVERRQPAGQRRDAATALPTAPSWRPS